MGYYSDIKINNDKSSYAIIQNNIHDTLSSEKSKCYRAY